MKKKTFFKWGIFLPVIFSLVLGCSGKGKSVKTIEGDPEIIYKQGLTRFNKRDYSEALKIFEQLKSSFPDSPPYTLWAELKVADCHFLKKDYVEAIAAYEEFKKIHPTHEEIPYVQYQIGMSYFNQIRTLDRDQTSTKKALSNFEYLVANYPSGLFTEKAKEKVGVCKKQLADHEFYIGNFYYKGGKFQAAARRFEELLKKFPKIPEEDKTLFFLGKSYIVLDQWEKAQAVFTQIVTEYPKSSHYKESRGILDQGEKKKVSPPKGKSKEAKKKDERAEAALDRITLVKFEEEGRQPVSMTSPISPISITSKSATTPPPPKEESKEITSSLAGKPMEEGRAPAIVPPSKAPLTVEVKPEEEKKIAALPSTTTPSEVKEKPRGKGILEPEQAKLVDTQEPIDIASDRVEAYTRENLIIFKGNVIARQKDIVIYADTLEAVIIEGGKGIEKVIAGGNVKVQQGLRVANCQKAVFYNPDQKVVLTGDPKVWEGDNMVSGDEIVFDIEKNQVEVKGGASGQGKVKIFPGGKLEKPK